MSDIIVKRDWVERVLDVEIDSDAVWGGPGVKLLPIWVEAKETVDAAIDRLQQALRADPDDELREIGEFGLHKASDGNNVGLMAALRDVDSGPSAQTRKKALAAVTRYRAFLQSPIVDLVENNEHGVVVPMAATLGPALDEIEAALRR